MADHFELEMRRPRELLAPFLLLLLAEAPGHGYELMHRLKPLGFDWNGPGPIYRDLRALEAASLIRSDWAVGSSGPGRRVYELTSAGRASLDRSIAGAVALHALAAEYVARVPRLPRPPRPPVAKSRKRAPKTPTAADRPSPRRRVSRRSPKTA